MAGIMGRVKSGVGCIHGERLIDCVHCMAEWAEHEEWERESEWLLEAVRLGEAPLDDTLDWLAYVEREAN